MQHNRFARTWVLLTCLLLSATMVSANPPSRNNGTNGRQNNNRNARNDNGRLRHTQRPVEAPVPTPQAEPTSEPAPEPPPIAEPQTPLPAPMPRYPGVPDYAPTTLDRLDKEEIPPGLPPALDGFLVLLLHVADIEAPNYAVVNRQQLSLAHKVMIFKSGVALLRRVYENPENYAGQAISSIQKYLELTEPTRGHSGSLSGDFQRLWYYVEKLRSSPESVPRAHAVNMPNKGRGDFSSELDNYRAQAYRYEMAAHLRRILASTALHATSGNSLSLMESVFRAIGTFLTNTPANWSSILNTAADVIDEVQTRPEQKPTGEPARFTDQLRRAASVTETVRKIAENEDRFVELLATMEEQDFDSIAALISSFEDSLNDIVTALKNVGSRIAESEQVRLLERSGDGYISELLKVLFDDYPKLLPATIFKDIILDLFRTPKKANDIDVLMIMLRHFGPILKNFLQTSSRYQEMQALARVFESLQSSANKVVPMEVVERIIAQDPNRYPITDLCNIGGEPKAGKFFQVHCGTMDGEQVLVRVMLPDVENTLEFERLILLKLAEPLSKIYIRGHTDRQSAIRRMKRLIEAKYLNHRIELNIPQTVANQNEARKRLHRDPVDFNTPHGPVRLSIDVPEAYPAVEGSRVMVTKLITDVVDIKDMVTDHPEVARAAANYLTTLFYDELAFRPLEEFRGGVRRQRLRAAQQPEEGLSIAEHREEPPTLGANFALINEPDELTGIAHGDLHGGNVLFQQVSNGSVPHYALHLIDWGLTSWVRAEEVESIAVMAYGAEFNHAQIITQHLLDLSDGSTYKPREIYALVDKKARELESKSAWWGPDEWISYMWIHGYLEFPNYLVALADARHALWDLRHQLGHSDEETKKFMAEMYRERAGLVVRRSISLHPWHGALSTKVPRRLLKYQAIRCIRAIIGEPERVDPWRG